jgi:hypothetical protein
VGEGGVVITTDRAEDEQLWLRSRSCRCGLQCQVERAGGSRRIGTARPLAVDKGAARGDLGDLSRLASGQRVLAGTRTRLACYTRGGGHTAPGRASRREALQRDVETRRWYCPPLHRLHPGFVDCRRLGSQGNSALPNTDVISRHLIGLPFHTSLSDSDTRAIVDALRDCL